MVPGALKKMIMVKFLKNRFRYRLKRRIISLLLSNQNHCPDIIETTKLANRICKFIVEKEDYGFPIK